MDEPQKAWQNVEGAIPPDWLQGRGTGSSGETLLLVSGRTNDDGKPEIIRVAPGRWVVLDARDQLTVGGTRLRAEEYAFPGVLGP